MTNHRGIISREGLSTTDELLNKYYNLPKYYGLSLQGQQLLLWSLFYSYFNIYIEIMMSSKDMCHPSEKPQTPHKLW